MKLKWLIVRLRVRLAKFIWPLIDRLSLPPLFTAVTNGVEIDRVALFDGDVILCEMEVGCALNRGDSWTMTHLLEIHMSSGENVKIAAQVVPCDGIPAMLYRDGLTKRRKGITDGITKALDESDG
ncbi:MAG: hypothetical protein KJ556_21335 [Gammaproteobacteria bacterium]|nr:hypothetical protein [Gammaproteobacteria bacterium]